MSGKFVIKDSRITIDGLDISSQCKSLEIRYSAELKENTAMQGSGFRYRVAGLKDWMVTFDVFQDFSTSFDATMFSVVGRPVTVTVRPNEYDGSETAIEYTGTMYLQRYSPILGGVGEVSVTQLPLLGSGPLVRRVVWVNGWAIDESLPCYGFGVGNGLTLGPGFASYDYVLGSELTLGYKAGSYGFDIQ